MEYSPLANCLYSSPLDCQDRLYSNVETQFSTVVLTAHTGNWLTDCISPPKLKLRTHIQTEAKKSHVMCTVSLMLNRRPTFAFAFSQCDWASFWVQWQSARLSTWRYIWDFNNYLEKSLNVVILARLISETIIKAASFVFAYHMSEAHLQVADPGLWWTWKTSQWPYLCFAFVYCFQAEYLFPIPSVSMLSIFVTHRMARIIEYGSSVLVILSLLSKKSATLMQYLRNS